MHVAFGRYPLHTAFDDDINVVVIIDLAGHHTHGQIHARGLFGHSGTARNLGLKALGGRLCQGGHHAKCTDVGRGCREISRAHSYHAATDNGRFDVEQLGRPGLHYTPLA